jgi:hypothetical protein
MISIGYRPWNRFTRRTFQAYCQAHNYDFAFIDDDAELKGVDLDALTDERGRKNKHIYGGKAYIPWRYLVEYGYQRVAVVDDSCSISADCPPLFDLVPENSLGGTRTFANHAQISFEQIRKHMPDGENVDYNTNDYMRSTLLVYGSSLADAISPCRTKSASSLLNSKHPHQTLTYYLMKTKKIPFFILDPAFLRLPGLDLPDADRRRMKRMRAADWEGAYVWAVTSVYRYRLVLASRIAIQQKFIWDCRTSGSALANLNLAISMMALGQSWLGQLVRQWIPRLFTGSARRIKKLFSKLCRAD